MLKFNILFITFASIFFIFAKNSFGQEVKETFKCTKNSNVNFRNGPSVKFAIIYKVFKKGYPVKVIELMDSWFAVEDFKGDKMWVSSVNLTSKCGKIVKKQAEIKLTPNNAAPIIATLEEGFIIHEVKCHKKWCEVKMQTKKGWVLKDELWG
jgi:SH3-like domain-containing protein